MAKISIPGYRTISAAQMRVGEIYRVWRHKTPCIAENAVFVRVVSRPECSIRDMNENDAYVCRIIDQSGKETGDVIRLVRNAYAPFFPITHVESSEPGKMVQSRVSVLVKES